MLSFCLSVKKKRIVSKHTDWKFKKKAKYKYYVSKKYVNRICFMLFSNYAYFYQSLDWNNYVEYIMFNKILLSESILYVFYVL